MKTRSKPLPSNKNLKNMRFSQQVGFGSDFSVKTSRSKILLKLCNTKQPKL